MRPIAKTDRHDRPRLIYELVPGVAAVVDDVVVGFEDPIGQPVIPHELPDIFDGVEFGAFRRQGQKGDVGRDDQITGEMPSGLIQQDHRMSARRHRRRDFFEVQRHRLGVAKWQNQASAFSSCRTDRPEQVGRLRSLVMRRRRARPSLGPATSNLVLLADPGFVAEPDLYVTGIEPALARDRSQYRRPLFLKSSSAS